MAYELKENQGSLFLNKDRRGEKDPNATGKLMVGNTLYYISAWTNVAKDGQKWMALRVNLPKAKHEAEPAPVDDSETCPF